MQNVSFAQSNKIDSLKSALKNITYDSLKIRTLSNISWEYLNNRSNPKLAKKYIDSVYAFSIETGSEYFIAKANYPYGVLEKQKGNYKEAIASFRSRTDGTNNNWMLGYTYSLSEQKEKAKNILNYQLEKNKSSFVPPYMIATIYMGLGDVANTLKWLEKDAEVGGQGLLFWALKRDVKFDSIREEIRFKKILETIK